MISNKDKEKKKRGMPEGFLAYPKEIILNQVKSEFTTTNDILHEFKKIKHAPSFSWNTVQKYLKLLADENKIEMRRVGKYNLWRRDKKTDEKIDEVSKDGNTKET